MLDRQVGGLFTFKNSTGIDSNEAMRFRDVCSITHYASCGGELASLVDRRNPVPGRQGGELFDMTSEKCRAADRETTRSQFRQLFERRIEVTFGAGVEDMKFKPE